MKYFFCLFVVFISISSFAKSIKYTCINKEHNASIRYIKIGTGYLKDIKEDDTEFIASAGNHPAFQDDYNTWAVFSVNDIHVEKSLIDGFDFLQIKDDGTTISTYLESSFRAESINFSSVMNVDKRNSKGELVKSISLPMQCKAEEIDDDFDDFPGEGKGDYF